MDLIKTPILLLFYNRPGLSKQLLDILKSHYRFSTIYISIDGPKESDNDLKKVDEVHELCKDINFSDNTIIHRNNKNKGCKAAVSQAIDWFFDNEDEGIILEDDCHPTYEFFIFIEAMLERYRLDSRVAQICGSNILGAYSSEDDYFYSNFGGIWGWATWKRAWSLYDYKLKTLNTSPRNIYNIQKKIGFQFDAKLRIKNFIDTKKGKIDTWDYQWIYSRLSQNMVCVIPKVALVTNVGIGNDGTHTFQPLVGKVPENLDEIRVNTVWDSCRKPLSMLPNYHFEKLVTERKRGAFGCGPIVCSRKLINKGLRYLTKRRED